MSYFDDYIADGLCCECCGAYLDGDEPGFIRRCCGCEPERIDTPEDLQARERMLDEVERSFYVNAGKRLFGEQQ